MATCPRCHKVLSDDFKLCPYDGAALDGSGEHAEPPPLPPPERAQLGVLSDRYEIKELLGHGGMAYVYRAMERATQIDVAIKVMNGKAARTSPGRERFLREAGMLSAIRHPNVVHVYASGDLADGAPYIVMEYLEGESLGELLRRGALLELGRALELAIDVAAGLCAAHDAGIIHRDIKPDNVFLVGPKGAPRIAKVVDFGLARLYNASGLTQKGMIVGTPEYMSPEQAVNDELDARTDVYGMGVVLYRLLTGHLPFMGQSEVEKLAMHVAVPPPPMANKRDGIPDAFETVVQSALRKDPKNRYSSMHALLEDLERVADGDLPLGVRPPAVDVYEPRTAFSASVAQTLRRKLQTA